MRSRFLLLIALLVLPLAGCGTSSSSKPASKVAAPLVHLPADQGGHAQAKNEWWYVVGHLHSGARTFGYEMTIFKFHDVRPPGVSTPISLYRTDVAITDEAGHRFHQSVTYHFPQSAQVSASTLNVRVGPDSLTGRSLGDMELSAALPGGSMRLKLASERTPMYVGGRGYVNFINGFTYYYSLTHLQTSGTLTVAGKTFQVAGVSWLDHQWGAWSWTSVRGWTWMALQLNNGIEMSVFDVRSNGKRQRLASVLTVNGKTRTVGGITIHALGTWRSPHTGGVYPSGWIVRIPALHASMRVTPKVQDQELVDPNGGRGSYWEGSGRVSGTLGGKPVTGLSYTELTGYARH